MRGVLDHGPYDIADRLAPHDRTGWQRLGEFIRAARTDEFDRVSEGLLEPLAGNGERGHLGNTPGVLLEVQIEAFRPRGAFDKPVDRLCRVRDLLRHGHHSVPRT